MTDESQLPQSGAPPTEAELQEPIDMLPPPTEDDEVTGAMFGRRVERAVHRRLLGASITDFCVLGPTLVALGLVVAVVGYWQRGEPAREDESDKR